MWLTGTEFLSENGNVIDKTDLEPLQDGNGGIKTKDVLVATLIKDSVDLIRIGNCNKLCRVIAYVRRLFNNCKGKSVKCPDFMTALKVIEAQDAIINNIQQSTYSR